MANYFNTLSLREKLGQLGCCRFMNRSEFQSGCDFLKGKKRRSIHPETSDLLESWLTILSEQGENAAFEEIRKSIKRSRSSAE